MAPSAKSKPKPSGLASVRSGKEAQEGKFILYPCNDGFKQHMASPQSRFLSNLLESSIEKFYAAQSRRKFILEHVLRKIPGGLYIWDESKKCFILLDEEEAYHCVSEKIRELKQNGSRKKVRFDNPPTRKSSKRKAPSPKITPKETDSQFKKPKITRKKSFLNQPVPNSARREPPTQAASVARPRKSPLRDHLVADPAKDELIKELQSEITHLRGLVQSQDMELLSLRMIAGNANGTPLLVPSASSQAMMSTGMFLTKAVSKPSTITIDAISTGTVPKEATTASSAAAKNDSMNRNSKPTATTTTTATTTVATTNTSGRDKHYAGVEVCCCATTAQGRACDCIAVGTTNCFMHADYDVKPPRRDFKCSTPKTSTGTTLVEAASADSSSSHSVVPTSTTLVNVDSVPLTFCDASCFTLSQLQNMASSNPTMFNKLDFSNVDDDATLLALFPNNSTSVNDYKLPPPRSWKIKASKIRAWRRLGRNRQEHYMQKEHSPPPADTQEEKRTGRGRLVKPKRK